MLQLKLKKLFLIFILLTANAVSLASQKTFVSPNNTLKITRECNKKTNECAFYLNEKAIIGDIPKDKATYKWIEDIFALNINLGSYNSYLVLVDGVHKPQTVSGVITIDAHTKCIMAADDAGIYFYKFFQLKPLKIILKHSKQFNFAKDVVSLQSIVQGKFKQKKVAMSYLNHVYESVDMVIDNPCAK